MQKGEYGERVRHSSERAIACGLSVRVGVEIAVGRRTNCQRCYVVIQL